MNAPYDTAFVEYEDLLEFFLYARTLMAGGFIFVCKPNINQLAMSHAALKYLKGEVSDDYTE